MKVLFDSNVIIDVLSKREVGRHYSVDIYREVALGHIVGCLSSKQITDIYYVLRKYGLADSERKEAMRILMNTFKVYPLLPSQLKLSLESDMDDYEDSVLDDCCSVNCINYLVTNNTKDFVFSKSIVITPEELCNLLHLI